MEFDFALNWLELKGALLTLGALIVFAAAEGWRSR
jgi:hypothetical protein